MKKFDLCRSRTKKPLVFLTMILTTAFFISSCSISVTTTSIHNVQVASQVDETNWEVLEATNTFIPTSPIIYVVGDMEDASAGTALTADWKYIEDGADILIDSATLELEMGSMPFIFSLSKPDNDWPLGSYEVNLYIDNKLDQTVNFTVK